MTRRMNVWSAGAIAGISFAWIAYSGVHAIANYQYEDPSQMNNAIALLMIFYVGFALVYALSLGIGLATTMSLKYVSFTMLLAVAISFLSWMSTGTLGGILWTPQDADSLMFLLFLRLMPLLIVGTWLANRFAMAHDLLQS